MKYLKFFESVKWEGWQCKFNKYGNVIETPKLYYWSVVNDEKTFIKSVKKINCPERIIDTFFKDIKNKRYNKKIIYIGVQSTRFNDTWDMSNDMKRFQVYKYKGKLFSNKEYNDILAQEMKDKYNL